MAGVSDELLDTVDEEVRRLIDECYQEARRCCGTTGTGSTLSPQLLQHETLDEAAAYAAAGIPHEASS